MKKRLVICLLAVALVLGLAIGANAAEGEEAGTTGPTISIGGASGISGKGATTIDVPITLSNNTSGFTGVYAGLSYDSDKLEMVVEEGEIAYDQGTYKNMSYTIESTGIAIYTSGTANKTGDGTLVTLKFKLKDSVTSNVTIALSSPADTSKAVMSHFNDEGSIVAVDGVVFGEAATITVTHNHCGSDDTTNATNVNTVAPDCTNAGYTSYTCGYCGQTVQEDGAAALGHDFVNSYDSFTAKVVEPSCTTDGSKTCGRCGVTFTKDNAGYEDLAATGHGAHGYNYVAEDPAAYKKVGTKEHWVCADCYEDGAENNVYFLAETNTDGSVKTFETADGSNALGKDGAYVNVLDTAQANWTNLEIPAIERIPGDVGGETEGVIDIIDVVLLARYVATDGTGVTINEANASVNGDEVIDIIDVVLLARYVATDGTGVTLQ